MSAIVNIVWFMSISHMADDDNREENNIIRDLNQDFCYNMLPTINTVFF